MTEQKLHPWYDYKSYPLETMQKRAVDFYTTMKTRRSIRDFSDRPVSRDIIENCIRTAATAPSGANMQPWHFVAISDPAIKHEIRIAAEAEEREFYEHRAPEDWLDALTPFDTDAAKPFLEHAPYLIAIFAQAHHFSPNGKKVKHYYVTESVGIATGLLVAACHHAGLASLTHTPSPMNFLNKILNRPNYERPFLLLVVGYPIENVQVPVISKKSLDEITTFI